MYSEVDDCNIDAAIDSVPAKEDNPGHFMCITLVPLDCPDKAGRVHGEIHQLGRVTIQLQHVDHAMRGKLMAATVGRAPLWPASIDSSAWRALAASWMGWMFDGYETYA